MMITNAHDQDSVATLHKAVLVDVDLSTAIVRGANLNHAGINLVSVNEANLV